MNKYLISYVKINDYTDNEVNRSIIYECEGKMTVQELEKAENFIYDENGGHYTIHLLSFSLIEEEKEVVQNLHTTWIWTKLFDKRIGDEEPVYINSKDIRLIQRRSDQGYNITVEQTEDGVKKMSTFITRHNFIYTTENDSTNGIPKSWLEGDLHPVEPSVFHNGWLTIANQNDSTPIM